VTLSQTNDQRFPDDVHSLMPPEEVTPEIIAMRGCIEGVDHPSEQGLSFGQQLSACDNWTQLLEVDNSQAVYFRALHLYENGTTPTHHEQAYRDFSLVINSETGNASAFANRAWLNLRYRDDLDEALLDIEQAIRLKADAPRSSYFERRAIILLEMASRNGDENLVYTALEDLRVALELNPNSTLASELEIWAGEFLRDLPAKSIGFH